MRSDRKFAVAFSIAALAVAVGAPAVGQAGPNSEKADPSGIISSYLGPLGLRADFNRYLKSTGTGNSEADVVDAFIAYAWEHDLELPPGIGGNDLPT